jgi:hypothetical protein
MQRVCAGPWRTDGGRNCSTGHRGRGLGRRCLREALRATASTRGPRGRRTRHFTAAVKMLSASAGLDPRRSRSQRSVESAGASPGERAHGTSWSMTGWAVRRSFVSGNSGFAIPVTNIRMYALIRRPMACEVDEHLGTASTNELTHCHRWGPRQNIFKRAMTVSEGLCVASDLNYDRMMEALLEIDFKVGNELSRELC